MFGKKRDRSLSIDRSRPIVLYRLTQFSGQLFPKLGNETHHALLIERSLVILHNYLLYCLRWSLRPFPTLDSKRCHPWSIERPLVVVLSIFLNRLADCFLTCVSQIDRLLWIERSVAIVTSIVLDGLSNCSPSSTTRETVCCR